MLKYTEELMLRSYFTAEVAVGRFCEDKQALFTAFAKPFLLGDEAEKRLYALTEREEVRSVASEKDYYLYRRMRQYYDLCRMEQTVEAEIDAIVDLKGSSISAAHACKLIGDAEEVRSVACENLTRAADGGSILALRTLGVLLMEGIVFGSDRRRGLHMIRMAADWDSEEGLLFALYYDTEDREKYLARLHGAFVHAGRLQSFERVSAAYGTFDPAKNGEYHLLEKAFHRGIVKRDTFVKSYERLIYSEILSERDKEVLVFSSGGELFAEASALPLKLTSGTQDIDLAPLSGLKPERAEACERIACALKNIDLRRLPAYRPLCIVSESKYVSDLYAAAIASAFAGAHVERIEVSDLAGYDFEPSKSNIFVRSCDEDLFNVYFMCFRGTMRDGAFEPVRNFLQSAKRSCFRLNHPSVTLDLSSVLPICFCDRENAARLAPYCDVVRIGEPTKRERRRMAEEIAQEKGKLYGVKELSLGEGIAERLSAYPVDELEKLIDAAIREHRAPVLCLTEDVMQPYFKGTGSGHNTYGFGGSIHESHE